VTTIREGAVGNNAISLAIGVVVLLILIVVLFRFI
jgi:hypothetical protein